MSRMHQDRGASAEKLGGISSEAGCMHSNVAPVSSVDRKQQRHGQPTGKGAIDTDDGKRV